jgi:hypothetical protein
MQKIAVLRGLAQNIRISKHTAVDTAIKEFINTISVKLPLQ